LHALYNKFKANIHTTQKHEIYKEARTCITYVVNRDKVNVFKAI